MQIIHSETGELSLSCELPKRLTRTIGISNLGDISDTEYFNIRGLQSERC